MSYSNDKTSGKLIPAYLESKKGMAYWKELIFHYLLLSLVVLGGVAYIVSVIASIRSELWTIVWFDTIVYLAVCLIFLFHRINFSVRVSIIGVLIYLLGVVLLIFTGPMGSGLIWLFAFPIITAIFGNRFMTIVSVSLTTLCLLVFAALLKVNSLSDIWNLYGFDTWLVIAINFITVNLMLVLSIRVLMTGLTKLLNFEQKQKRIEEEQKEAIQATAKKLQEANNLKHNFIRHISHEVRTPLNAITGFAEILVDEHTPDSQKETYYKYIWQSSHQLIRMMEDMIQFSQLSDDETGTENYSQINLQSFIQDIFSDLKKILSELGKMDEISVDIRQPEKTVIFRSDERLLKRVFNSLIDNAVKFTTKGKIVLGCEIISKEEPKELRFFVSDTGIGLKEEDLQHVFEPFAKISENEILYQGVGLGLAISKQIVEHLGGAIRIESEFGKGTTVIVSIHRDSFMM